MSAPLTENREESLLQRAFQGFIRTFSLNTPESRRDFWPFMLIGAPLVCLIAMLLLGGGLVGNIARAWYAYLLTQSSEGYMGDLAADLAVTQNLIDAYAWVPTWVLVYAIPLTAVALLLWLLLSVFAATRRRLIDAASNRNLAWVWLLTPFATMFGYVTMALFTLLIVGIVGLFVPVSFAASIVFSLIGVCVPSLIAVIMVLRYCVRDRPTTVSDRQPKLIWPLLVMFVPAAFGLLISLPFWPAVAVWLVELAATVGDVVESVMTVIGVILVSLLALPMVPIAFLSMGSSPSTTKVAGFTRRGKGGKIIKVRGFTRKRR